MFFLIIYLGLCLVTFLLIVVLLKISPSGWQDKKGFHQLTKKHKSSGAFN
jgi:hypothetical protein